MKDFFVSYTGQDRTWAEWIAWVLEETGYTVVIQAWDFRPGGNFVLDMQRATIEAKRTIAVLSELYLNKPFPQPEWAAAFAQDPMSTDRKLIPVRVENYNPPGLLAQIVYVDVFDCEETEAQQRLLSAVTDGRMKPAQRPRFPGKEPERTVPNHVPFPGVTQEAQPSVPHNATSKSQTLALSLSAYDAETWVGRDDLIATLTQKLQSGCRLLALVGITGIGKTALAERLVVAVKENGVPFHRLNFDDRGQGRDFFSSALSLLPKLGETVTAKDQKDQQAALEHLLRTLRNNCFLVQIDSLEMVLEGDEQTGWNAFTDALWLDFFQQLLAGADCQSHILLTSQSLPEELEEVGSRYPRSWHRQDLGGLSEAEQLQLFEKFGLKPDGLCADVLKRFVELYQGHPLVLQVIAKDILEKPFNGNVRQYWQRYRVEFEEIERESRGRGSSPRSLQLRVKQRIEQSLKRLPADAYQMLCRSSVYRRSVPEGFWLAVMEDLTEDRQWAALELLKSHYFAEQELRVDGALLLRQHNLVRSVARWLLKMDKLAWREAEHIAARVWLDDYEPEPSTTKMEQVRGYLEAFHHNCEVENWEAAKAILIDQGVGRQLQTWGYFREMLPLYERILGKLEASVNVDCERRIGNAYRNLSNYSQAIEHFEKSLETARSIGDYFAAGKALSNLGGAYWSLSNYSQAIECDQQYLSIAREIGDRKSEGNALRDLGFDYQAIGNYSQAIKCHQQHLTIAREIGDREGEGNALGNIGDVYHSMGNYSQAIEYHQQHLTIAREIGNSEEELYALGNLGTGYQFLGNQPQAIQYSQQRLDVAREAGDRKQEEYALCNLGNAYQSFGNYSQAIEYHQQHLAIACEIGHRRGEGVALNKWGVTLIKLEQYSEAQQYLQTALAIFQEIGDRFSQAKVFLGLGELHHKTGQADLAKEYGDRALAIATELGIPLVKECEELLATLQVES